MSLSRTFTLENFNVSNSQQTPKESKVKQKERSKKSKEKEIYILYRRKREMKVDRKEKIEEFVKVGDK